MTKTLSRFFSACLIILLSSKSQGQIAGSFTVPGSYPSIAAAINTLNLLGVSGPVTINVTAGHTETAVTGGYKLYSVTGASSTNQITFMKSGSGANPLIYAYTGGTCYPSSSLQDGVWQLVGADHIIIDGIDIYDPNTSNPSTMEFGYGLYPKDAGDGCQHNTIKNCAVTLNRINSGAGAALIIGGSRGIEMVASSYTNAFSALTATSLAGANSYNKIYSNSIQNCNIGISIMCSNYSGSNAGQQNDVGGTSAATGNTITNFGGYPGNESSGIRTSGQISQNISFNKIINNDGSGSYPASNLHGIRTSNTGTNVVTNNTISLAGSPAGQYGLYGIYNTIATISQINNNAFPSFSYTNTSTMPSLIYSQNSPSTTISGNLSRNFISAGDPRIFWCAGTGSCTANSNTITNAQGTGISLTGFHFTGPHITINDNLLDSVINGITPFYGIDVTGASSGNRADISNNILRNSTGTIFRGIRTALGIPFMTVNGNHIYNIKNGTINGLGFVGIELVSSTQNGTVSANSIYSITSTGSGVMNNALIIGMRLYGDQKVFRNRVGGFYSNGTNRVSGIDIISGTQQIHNNLVGDLVSTGSTHTCGISGISFNGYPSSTIYYNSVYLNSASTGTNFGSTALLLANSSTLTIKNNIFVNTSVCTGTGITSAVRKVYGNTVANDCNHNILYAGPPSTNHVIYAEELAPANTFSILAAYKAYIAPNESQSYTENPPFLSADGNLPNFLTVDPFIPTQIEGLASPISTYTFDYTNVTRSATAPDIGAREVNYTAADITPPVLNSSGFIGSVCNAGTGRTFTASLSDVSGIGSGTVAPRLFYRVNLSAYASAQGSLTAGTTTNGVWTFSLSYSANPSDVIFYFFGMQDASAFSNFTIIPSAGSLGSDVNNVITAPSTVSSYTVQGPPNILVTSGTVCAGSNFTLVASGASTYTFSSGSAIVNPTTNTTYSVTGTSSAGCLSANAAVATVSAMPLPTVSVNSGSICSGQSFTIVPSGAISYVYSGGSAVVSPSTNTSYSVTGTNSLGCSSNPALATVSVFTTPTVTAPNGTVCAGSNFTISPTGAASYSFSGGSAVVSPSANSVYTVYGTSTAGCVSSSLAITASVIALPSISVNSGTVCSGKSFTLTPSGAASYTFSGGSAIVTPASSTSYSVIGKSVAGCVSSNTAVANVTVFGSPVLTVNSGSICAGETFTILPQGAASYTYGGGSAIVSPLSNTTYTVAGTGSMGCVSTAAATVTVFANPTVTAAGGTVCIGNSFSISPAGAASFSISGGSAIVNPAANTTYSVFGTSTAGCISNTVVLTVSVVPLPTVSVNSGSICAGTVFTMVPNGAATYFYSGGSATVSPISTSSYSVSGINAFGCASSNTAVATVAVFTVPVISVAGPTMICKGTNVILNASGAKTYTWDTGDTTSAISDYPLISKTYSVTGTGANGCSVISFFSVAVSTCLGINETPAVSGISIYPNPATGKLFMSVDQTENGMRIDIYNSLSQLILTSALKSHVTEINLTEEPRGIYFVKLFLGHKLIKTEKVVVSE